MKQINLNGINRNRILISILGLIIIVLASNLFVKCENNKTALSTNKALTSELSTYKLKNNELVKSQEVAFLDKKTLENNIIDKDKELKEMASKFSKVIAVQTIGAKTTIPKTVVVFKDPISIKEIDTITKELDFKRNGSFHEKWYEFGYIVTQDNLTIEPFNTWTDIKRVDGFKKSWFLGKKTYHSDVMFTNPYINTNEVQTYQVAVPVKWHETRAFNIGIGLIGGFLIAK